MKAASLKTGEYRNPNPSRYKRSQMKKEALKTLVLDFDNISIGDFLDAAASFYNEWGG